MKSIKNFIKENYSDLIILSILFLFFLEMISSLVESIYILDLLNTTLDEKVLGILFFLTPLFLIPFRKGLSKKVIDILAIIIIIFRILNPFMDTPIKIITAGIGVGCFMIYFPAYLSKVNVQEEEHKSIILGLGLAFAVILSITFKAPIWANPFAPPPLKTSPIFKLSLGLSLSCELEKNPKQKNKINMVVICFIFYDKNQRFYLLLKLQLLLLNLQIWLQKFALQI